MWLIRLFLLFLAKTSAEVLREFLSTFVAVAIDPQGWMEIKRHCKVSARDQRLKLVRRMDHGFDTAILNALQHGIRCQTIFLKFNPEQLSVLQTPDTRQRKSLTNYICGILLCSKKECSRVFIFPYKTFPVDRVSRSFYPVKVRGKKKNYKQMHKKRTRD